MSDGTPSRPPCGAGGTSRSLHQRFGSWFLTLARLQLRPLSVESVLRRHGPGCPQGRCHLLRIRPPSFPPSLGFVPNFIAAARIGRIPWGTASFVDAGESRWSSRVAVADLPPGVDVLARAAASPQWSVIERLNPTPGAGSHSQARISTVGRGPVGQRKASAGTWSHSRLERVSFVGAPASPGGETLSAVARLLWDPANRISRPRIPA